MAQGGKAFEKLQKLGEEKFKAIVNGLMRDKPTVQVARMIQQEWGDCTDISEKTLHMQLSRLKEKAAEGMFGEEAKALMKKEGVVNLKALRGSSVSVMQELNALVEVQRERIEVLFKREQELKMPISGLSAVINDMADLLVKTQKVRFDLGVDEFKGPLPGMKFTSETVQKPDGSMGQRTTMEAISTMQDVFQRRRIEAQVPRGADA